jgi:hypothetical protein
MQQSGSSSNSSNSSTSTGGAAPTLIGAAMQASACHWLFASAKTRTIGAGKIEERVRILLDRVHFQVESAEALPRRQLDDAAVRVATRRSRRLVEAAELQLLLVREVVEAAALAPTAARDIHELNVRGAHEGLVLVGCVRCVRCVGCGWCVRCGHVAGVERRRARRMRCGWCERCLSTPSLAAGRARRRLASSPARRRAS